MKTCIKCKHCENSFELEEERYEEWYLVEEQGYTKMYKFICPKCKHEKIFNKEKIENGQE